MATIYIPDLLTGSDKIVQFVLWTDATKTVAINLNNLTNIIVWIYDSSLNVIERYAKIATAGHNVTDFKVTDAVNGEFEINMRRETLLTACEGTLSFEIKYAETDVDFTNSKYVSYGRESIFNIIHTLSQDQSL